MGQKTSKKGDFAEIFDKAKANIVIMGVRKSGLTSIMRKLVPKNNLNASCSMGNALTKLTPSKGVSLTMWGVGFGLQRPTLWQYYLKKAEGLFLVVDSCNHRTLVAMKEEMDTIFASNVLQPHLPVVILANKQDLPNARSAADIADILSLPDFSIVWSVQCCSAVTEEGLFEGARKLFELVRLQKFNSERQSNDEGTCDVTKGSD